MIPAPGVFIFPISVRWSRGAEKLATKNERWAKSSKEKQEFKTIHRNLNCDQTPISDEPPPPSFSPPPRNPNTVPPPPPPPILSTHWHKIVGRCDHQQQQQQQQHQQYWWQQQCWWQQLWRLICNRSWKGGQNHLSSFFSNKWGLQWNERLEEEGEGGREGRWIAWVTSDLDRRGEERLELIPRKSYPTEEK